MLIMIQKDAATKISKEVETLEDAQVFANNGFHVSVQNDEGVMVDLADVVATQVPADDETEMKTAAKKTAAQKK